MTDESFIQNARREVMVRLALVIALLAFASPAWAAGDDIVGTYRLISANRVILATGDTEDSYGNNPIGFMTYGRDGRMMGMIVFSNRPKAESLEKMTDQQRADLFRTMIAYGGTYTFRGDSVEHHIDISWNELWTGTTVIRDIKKDGDRLVYTTKPAPFPRDGKMSINTLVWEKVK
jgi:Lipocalin-like domain